MVAKIGMRTSPALTLLGLGVAACSASGRLDPGAGNDPGTGTGSLAIAATVYASPRKPNARLSTDFDVDLTVRVSLNQHAVSDGTVTVTSASGKVALTYHGDDCWSATTQSYDQVYVLDVVTGADTLAGARVDGPDIHVFSQPTEREPVDASLPLLLRWQRENLANAAAVRIELSSWGAIADSGSYSVSPGALHADKSQAREHTLRVARTNSVTPAGAQAGSTWSVTVENDIDVVTPPQPL